MQARIAGALGAHAASAGMGSGQLRRVSSGLHEQTAAEMAQVAPQLRALRIDSEAPIARISPSGTGVRYLVSLQEADSCRQLQC